jgi:GNAT superfamily N-acetyltransferase
MLGIREAGADEQEAIGAMLHEAFKEDPVSRWVFPDAAHRETAHRRLFDAFTEASLLHGTVHVTEEGDGAALWYYMQDGHLVGEDDYGKLIGEAVPDGDRLPILGELTGELHPSERDHAYLQAIGVSSPLQSKGVGGRLLEAMLERLDRDGIPAYLEASTARSRVLYERKGFVFTGKAVELPDGPPLWPMWREPRTV